MLVYADLVVLAMIQRQSCWTPRGEAGLHPHGLASPCASVGSCSAWSLAALEPSIIPSILSARQYKIELRPPTPWSGPRGVPTCSEPIAVGYSNTSAPCNAIARATSGNLTGHYTGSCACVRTVKRLHVRLSRRHVLRHWWIFLSCALYITPRPPPSCA